MELTKKKLAEFVGRDMEIQLRSEGFIYRGRIKSATIENNIFLIIKFEWLAKGEGWPPVPISWIKEDRFASDAFVRNLNFYNISETIDGRLNLYNPSRDESLILFPPGKNLDPTKVKGFKLPIEKVPA